MYICLRHEAGEHAVHLFPQKGLKLVQVAGSPLWRDAGAFSHSVHVKWVGQISCSEKWHQSLSYNKQVLLLEKKLFFISPPNMCEVTLYFQSQFRLESKSEFSSAENLREHLSWFSGAILAFVSNTFHVPCRSDGSILSFEQDFFIFRKHSPKNINCRVE